MDREAIQRDRQIMHDARQNLAYLAFTDSSPLGRPEAGHYRNGFNHHIEIVDADADADPNPGWYKRERPELTQPSLGKRWLARVKPGPDAYQYLPVVQIDIGFEELGNVWYGGRSLRVRQTNPHPPEYTDEAKKVPKKRGFVKNEVVFVKVNGKWVCIPPNLVQVGPPPPPKQAGSANALMMVDSPQMSNAPQILNAPKVANAPMMASAPQVSNAPMTMTADVPHMAQAPPTADKSQDGWRTEFACENEWLHHFAHWKQK
jgi:hypothetical protein